MDAINHRGIARPYQQQPHDRQLENEQRAGDEADAYHLPCGMHPDPDYRVHQLAADSHQRQAAEGGGIARRLYEPQLKQGVHAYYERDDEQPKQQKRVAGAVVEQLEHIGVIGLGVLLDYLGAESGDD